MKKLLVLLLALTMLVCFVACGEDDTSDTDAGTDAPVSDMEDTEADTDDTESDTEPEETEEEPQEGTGEWTKNY